MIWIHSTAIYFPRIPSKAILPTLYAGITKYFGIIPIRLVNGLNLNGVIFLKQDA